MESYELEEVASGDDHGCLWISLGFVTDDNPYDVLHIVVAREVTGQDRRLRQDTVYLERYDQSMSCYGGSSNIEVAGDTVTIHLTPNGRQNLGFRSSVCFRGFENLQGKDEAKRIFEQMSTTECGALVSVHDRN